MRHGLGEGALLDVQVDGAARKASADLDVLAAQKRRLALAGLRHGGHLVAIYGSTDVSIKSRPFPVPLGLGRGPDSA